MQQVATLPFVALDGDIEVLLITSRRRKRWIVPKGWPRKHLTLAQSAAGEAEEEAGLIGPVLDEPVGTYSYDKQMDAGYSVLCHVFVYPLLVRQHLTDWQERHERRLRWTSLHDAAEKVDDRDLAELLEALAVGGAAALHAFSVVHGDWQPEPLSVRH